MAKVAVVAVPRNDRVMLEAQLSQSSFARRMKCRLEARDRRLELKPAERKMRGNSILLTVGSVLKTFWTWSTNLLKCLS